MARCGEAAADREAQVVAFYESRFEIVFTAQERSDLLMFLRSL
jgi:hypothetical protein